MRRVSLGMLAASFLVSAVMAQSRPDFNGTWVEDESQRKSPYEAAAGGGARAMAGPPPPLLIEQTADAIAIERTWIEKVRHVHHFDGREDKNRNGAQVHTTRTRWDGARLVTEGVTLQSTNQGETYWKVKEVRWLSPKGELMLETTRIDESGDARTVHQVYKRAKR